MKTRPTRETIPAPYYQKQKMKLNRKEYDGLRIRGTPQKNSEDSRERHEHDLSEVNAIFSFLSVEADITDLKRIWKFDNQRQPRTIIVKVTNE